ncbi:excisionase [Luteimonas wenzhouensis]|uniref:Excisionase n=1 Tax=Luteimonas wenzhouensis TaxID=2599615 RepID=A0A5C5U8G0_9GAMM|nr:excisionase [Luteimonas wenzhouensis]
MPECTKRGIGRTKAYELANAGLLETFSIGTKRYVFLDSLLSLPERLAQRGAA